MKKFLLIIALLISASALWAYDFSAVCGSGQTLYYNITSSTEPYTVEVTSQIRATSSNNYTNYSTYPTGDLIIPSSVTYSGRTYSITSIGTNTFYNCSELTSVTIPNNVTNIGGGAFDRCFGLISVTIGNSVTNIGMSAFNYCHSLTSVTIPNSVRSIGDYAFKLCGGLTEITIGNGVTSIEGHSFEYCSNLTKVNYTGTIAQWCKIAFEGLCANPLYYAHNLYINDNLVSDLVIPETDEEIKQYAFVNAKCLTSVTIPNSVTSIGTDAFTSCSGLTAVYYSGTIAQWCGITFNSNPLANAHNLYVDNNLVTNLVIPNTVTEIKNRAFQGATCLTSVTIPNSVTSIGDRAFTSCSGLTDIYANPTTPPTVGNSAFENVNATLWVTCGLVETYHTADGWSNFSDIREHFHYTIDVASANSQQGNVNITQQPDCTNDGNAIITATSTDGYVFAQWNDGNTDNPRTLTVTQDTVFTAQFELARCLIASGTCGADGDNLTWTLSCDSVLTISGSGAMEDYSSTGAPWYGNYRSKIKTLVIDDGVTSIGDYAFEGCSGLTELIIPNSVMSIGNNTFFGCRGLTSITIGSGVTSIGQNAFYNCSGITGTLVIPNSVTSIGNSAFYGCRGLSEVTIGNSVTSIGSAAVADCNGLTTLNFNAENCTEITGGINAFLFGSNNTLSKITIGENVATIPNNTFKNCTSLDSIISAAANPPEIFASTFDSQLSLNIPVVVPCGTVETYSEADFWYTFRRIQQNASCPVSYNITVLSSNPNFGTVSGGGEYMENTTATLTATPATNYRFVNWSDGSTDNPHEIIVTADATYIATFAIAQHTITVESSNPAMGTVSGGGTYDHGAERQIFAIPAEHYHFVSWNDGNTENPRTITIESDSTFTANFAIDQFTITVVSANETMGTVSEGGTYDYGTEIQISAIANDNYHFVQWTDGNTDNPRTITVTIDTTYTATFTEDVTNYTITAVSANPSQGIVTGGGTYPEGTVVTLTATANEGYQFLQWSDNSTENPRQITVTEDAVYVASFTETVATYTITVISANPSQGTVDGGGTYQEGAVATLTATANEGYRFLSWSDNSTENPHYITVTEDAMYIATFEVDNSQQSIYVTINETACGSYTWNDSTYTQSGEYQQTFTATTSVDSIVTLVLEIFPLPEPEITATGILDACNPSSVTLSAGNYSAYNWNTGESTETITVTEPGNYYVEVVDGHGCHGYSEMLEVGYSNTLTEAPQLKRVGMSNTGTNIVQWTVANTEGIAGFEIYREDNIANVYTLIQRVDRPGVRSCTDQTANPSARAYRYKICAVDVCGGLSPLSEPHKTMHLTINRGIGNTWNLIWSPYEGMEFASYKIYRGSTIQNMVVIGEVPSTMNTFTDSDNPACAGFFYKVVIVANTRSDDEDEMLLGSNIVDNGLMPEYTITAVSANPNQGTVVGGGTYPEGSIVALAAIPADGYEFLSWSDESTDNPHYITVTGDAVYVATFVPATDIMDNALPEIAFFPNPTNDILNITSSETISEIEIVNVMGQVVRRIEVNSDNAVCDVNELKAGVYVVRIRTLRYFGEAQQPQAQGAALRKFVKE